VVAIQFIINNELDLAKNQNPLQGAFIIEELTDLLEEALVIEFDRFREERMYQRSKIQSESMYCESLKHSGELSIVSVNAFLSSTASLTVQSKEVKSNPLKFNDLAQ
jgi:methylmalonyl-CoA mutase